MATKPPLGPGIAPLSWGARVNYDQWTDRFTPDDGIAIHYGGGSNIAGDATRAAGAGFDYPSMEVETHMLRRWERFHLGKGWRGLAYGWAIGQSGTIYRARGWNRYGAHLGDVDGDGIANNDEVIPVVFILGKNQPPTEMALVAFEDLRGFLEFHSNALHLWGHKEVQAQSTSCPGENAMMPYVRTHRESNAPIPPPPPEPEEDIVSRMPTLSKTFPDNPAAEGSKERDHVRRAQALLAIAGEIAANTFDDQHRPDGLFGSGTKSAVVRFQRDRGLVADGVIAEQTWEHLLGLADN